MDPQLTGYGAAYRIYRGSDDRWFALVVPDADTWSRLREIVAETALPERPPPLRTPGAPPDPTEEALEQVFAGREVVAWVDELRAAGVPTELVVDVDRAEFAARLLDDPLNRQLGRVASYSVAERGKLEQMSLALRLGPDPTPLPAGFLPGLGAHTNEVLEEIGFVLAEREKFVATEAVKLG